MNKLCAIICLLLAVIVLPVVAFAQSQTNQSFPARCLLSKNSRPPGIWEVRRAVAPQSAGRPLRPFATEGGKATEGVLRADRAQNADI